MLTATTQMTHCHINSKAFLSRSVVNQLSISRWSIVDGLWSRPHLTNIFSIVDLYLSIKYVQQFVYLQIMSTLMRRLFMIALYSLTYNCWQSIFANEIIDIFKTVYKPFNLHVFSIIKQKINLSNCLKRAQDKLRNCVIIIILL